VARTIRRDLPEASQESLVPNIRIPKGWELPERELTPEWAFLNRRELLRRMGFAGIGAAAYLAGCGSSEVDAQGELAWKPTGIAGKNPNAALYPAARNPRFSLDRPLTAEKATATYNNYYEFTTEKSRVWKLAESFDTRPWEVEIVGHVSKPGRYLVDDLVEELGVEERAYRHRCVEAWAMAVPWTGFAFAKLIEKVGVKNDATHVRLVTFFEPDQAFGQRTQPWYPWPYYEGMTMAEAMNELTFVATGIYGHELPAQNGAPWRLVLPWKYGFKSIKAMVRIDFTDKRPTTFWNSVAPDEYDFVANVDPAIPHPRWSQARERLIDTGDYMPTQKFNGYGEWVASLYG
jgi:sulfoxide reductase catalytic subunit YedY